jgi:hypothetical protein
MIGVYDRKAGYKNYDVDSISRYEGIIEIDPTDFSTAKPPRRKWAAIEIPP